MKFKHRHSNQSRFEGLQCYGKRFVIRKEVQHRINCILGVVIPGIYPVPVALAINKYILRKDIQVRYDH